MYKKTLGQYLKDKRIENRFTQSYVASKLNLDRSLISKYENDDLAPNDEVLNNYCLLLEADFKYARCLYNPNLHFQIKKRVIICAFFLLFSLISFLLFLIPFLRYPGTKTPYSPKRVIIYASLLNITLQLHNPMALINVILLAIHMVLSCYAIFSRHLFLDKVNKLFLISTIVLYSYTFITLIVSTQQFLFFFYY